MEEAECEHRQPELRKGNRHNEGLDGHGDTDGHTHSHFVTVTVPGEPHLLKSHGRHPSSHSFVQKKKNVFNSPCSNVKILELYE